MARGREKAKLRLARFLALGPAACAPAAKTGHVLVDGGKRGVVAALKEDIDAMVGAGLLEVRGSRFSLSDAGFSWLKRCHAQNDPMREQHGVFCHAVLEMPDGASTATINLAESPLALLARRKAKSGHAFLAEAEWRAGERLRADYTRAQIMPRLGANWQAAVSSGRRTGGVADLTDSALAARRRVENAVVAVGPELSGVLIDVCCFLKGLETVERERGWPARSAKIVLKAALGALGRHYAPPASPASRKAIVHWGAQDYRPSITS
jgi:hypothetical protein